MSTTDTQHQPKRLPDLSGFTGSEEFYRHALVRAVIYTHGVQHLAETVGAYWLIDEIAIAQVHDRVVKAEAFQVWKLAVDEEGSGATLSVEDGNDHLVTQKRIEYTDFPRPGITLWCIDGTVLLPSEY
jgi:hypothetical protein